MKLLIQLTFNNGLGNLYCGLVEILHFIENYINLGYKCELIFASNSSAGGNKYINYIKFEDIFDVTELKVFDNIRNVEYSIRDKFFENYTYHSTQYGADSPGVHWWDVFFDKPPEIEYPKNPYNMETLIYNQYLPKVLPKFNKIVYDKASNFIKKNNDIYDAIHVRYYDYTFNVDDSFELFTQNLLENLKYNDKIFHVMSNNQYLIDTIKDLSNVRIYEFQNLDILPNDHSYYFYHKNIDNELILNRFYDNLAEMVSLTYYKNIYYYTTFGWISTFLYYSKSNNTNQNLIKINNQLNLIS